MVAIIFTILAAIVVAVLLYTNITTFEDDVSDTEYLSDEIHYDFTKVTEVNDDPFDEYDPEWYNDCQRGR